MLALKSHGGVSEFRLIALASQDVAQSPQKVHSPLAKLISGKPLLSMSIIFSGQAVRQSPHFVQVERNFSSASDQGGRIEDFHPLKAFLKNSDLDNVAVIKLHNEILNKNFTEARALKIVLP